MIRKIARIKKAESIRRMQEAKREAKQDQKLMLAGCPSAYISPDGDNKNNVSGPCRTPEEKEGTAIV